ncbi:MAG: DUF4142 domain-containing protein [Pseudomonadota bacterium]|nr:DUF4142 domain-containing protein [Pseudomonadota bacterium]
MSPTKSWIVAAMVVALGAACTPADDATTDTAVTTTPDMTTPTTTTPMGTPTEPTMGAGMEQQASQGEAVAMLVAVNEHDIAAAEQAIEENVTGEVREFAEMLRTDHTRNLEQTRQLANSPGMQVADTQMVESMREKGQKELERLSQMEGDAYRKAFLDMMVRDHTEALSMIDNRMMPATTDASFRQHLTATREAISKHLERARELQGMQQ